MSRSFVNNMSWYLDEQGALSASLSKQTGKLALMLGNIVTAVTSTPDMSQAAQCWNSLQRKRCMGKIDASIDVKYFDIVWHCLCCGNHGSISHWKKTLWDRGFR